jgi:hypothetical protein
MKTRFSQTHAKHCKIAVSNYESPALTAELQARDVFKLNRANR